MNQRASVSRSRSCVVGAVLTLSAVFACSRAERNIATVATRTGDQSPVREVIDLRTTGKSILLHDVVIGTSEEMTPMGKYNVTVWVRSHLSNLSDELFRKPVMKVSVYDEGGRRVASGDATPPEPLPENTLWPKGRTGSYMVPFRFEGKLGNFAPDAYRERVSHISFWRAEVEIRADGRALPFAVTEYSADKLRNPPKLRATEAQLLCANNLQSVGLGQMAIRTSSGVREFEAFDLCTSPDALNELEKTPITDANAGLFAALLPVMPSKKAALAPFEKREAQINNAATPHPRIATDNTVVLRQSQPPSGPPAETPDARRSNQRVLSNDEHDAPTDASVTADAERVRNSRSTPTAKSTPSKLTTAHAGTEAEEVATKSAMRRVREVVMFDSMDHGATQCDGKAAKSLSDLSSKLDDRNDVNDGWHRAMRLVPLSDCNVSFALWSAGPNGQFDAEAEALRSGKVRPSDDVILIVQNGSDRWISH